MKPTTFPEFSEEKLAAFIDGKLSPAEMSSFKSELEGNPVMQVILKDVKEDIIDSVETATVDFPGFQPEETLSHLIPFVENTIQDIEPSLSSFDELSIPSPVFDEVFMEEDDSNDLNTEIETKPFGNDSTEQLYSADGENENNENNEIE